jgi:biopolymer transport protein ExbD
MGAPVGGGDQDAISDINIVPLVDIILVVLIIFMVTAPTSQSGKVEVDLPSAATGETSSEGAEPLQIVLTAEGRILVDGESVSESAVRAMAQEAANGNSQAQAVITADKNLPHGDVVKMMDTLKGAGIAKLSVSTTQALEE